MGKFNTMLSDVNNEKNGWLNIYLSGLKVNHFEENEEKETEEDAKKKAIHKKQRTWWIRGSSLQLYLSSFYALISI